MRVQRATVAASRTSATLIGSCSSEPVTAVTASTVARTRPALAVNSAVTRSTDTSTMTAASTAPVIHKVGPAQPAAFRAEPQRARSGVARICCEGGTKPRETFCRT